MRHLSIAAFYSAFMTLVAAFALRAADATVAIVAVASIAVLLTWYASLHATEEHSSVGLANPGSAVALAVVGRRPWATLLPVIVAHVVGAVVGGLAALALDDRLGDTLIFASPDLVTLAVGALLVGLVLAWTTLTVDGGASEAFAAVPAFVSGAVLPLGAFVAFQPAAVIGLATAGLLEWDAALVAAGAVLIGTLAGAFGVGLLLPADE